MIDFIFGVAAGMIVGCTLTHLVHEWTDKAINGGEK